MTPIRSANEILPLSIPLDLFFSFFPFLHFCPFSSTLKVFLLFWVNPFSAKYCIIVVDLFSRVDRDSLPACFFSNSNPRGHIVSPMVDVDNKPSLFGGYSGSRSYCIELKYIGW